MGYMQHHSIIISGPGIKYDNNPNIDDVICKIKVIASQYGFEQLVSPLCKSKINDYKSFFIAPDGSKEGWDLSEQGDKFRNDVKQYLKTLCYSDGSTSFKWVEVQFADDNGETKIIESSDDE